MHERRGVVAAADRIARSVGQVIPDVAAAFLEEQHLVVVAAVGDGDRVWASALAGPAGFLRAVDDRTMAIDAPPPLAVPLTSVQEGAEVGTIVLDPATRRRMRVNGRLLRSASGGLLVEADEVVSNCPKYIARRRVDVPPTRTPELVSSLDDRLSPADVDVVRNADTFFLATTGGADAGLDASHRGGNPGFVQVVGAGTLSWREYPGNNMYLSLGNLVVDERAGVTFVDWDGGRALQLSGRARLDWAGPDDPSVVLEVEAVRRHASWTDGRWSLVERSRFNPPA